MRGLRSSALLTRSVAALLATVMLLTGCTVVGPSTIRSGRLAYNEAINETNDQQMLMVMVRNRYQESNSLMAVASVTANVRVTTNAGIQAGFGDVDDYSGNLVPFTGGVVYEENPTISYRPVAGAAYLQQVTTPLPLPLFTRLAESAAYSEHIYGILLSSVNGIPNPSFVYEDQADDPRFDRFVALMSGLTRSHAVRFVQQADDPDSLAMIVDRSDAEIARQAGELLDLLGVQAPKEEGARLLIPVTSAPGREGASSSVFLSTRTIFELVEILSARVMVPAEHDANGMAARVPAPGRPGRAVRIHHAEERPDEAYVAVERDGDWFYIDSRDPQTKRYFKLLGTLWSAAMEETLGQGDATPVLTVPVSR